MGMAGFKGKVYYIDDECPAANWAAPSGSDVDIGDEVTKFTIEDSVKLDEYGHDKSEGWEDACAGTRGLVITVDAKIASTNVSGVGGNNDIWAGRTTYLKLFPFGATGTCNTPAAGYGVVRQVSYTYDQETGKAISYTATIKSRGPWTGVGGTAWGGFECACT